MFATGISTSAGVMRKSYPVKKTLSTCLACSLLLPLQSIAASGGLVADSKAVSAVEYLYAGLSDANTLLAAIGSGLLNRYLGKDRAAWARLYNTERAQLTKALD